MISPGFFCVGQKAKTSRKIMHLRNYEHKKDIKINQGTVHKFPGNKTSRESKFTMIPKFSAAKRREDRLF
jgi:hypothetical protein